MRFRDPTFIDYAVRRRANYKISGEGDKNRLCWLLAQAVTAPYETHRERILSLQRWVCQTVPHVFGGDWRGRGDFYRIHTLDVITRGWAWCEATAEVFATLAWLAGYPARVLSVQRDMSEPVVGHHVNEVWMEGKWCFVDADQFRVFEGEEGTLASALELTRHQDWVRRVEEARHPEDWWAGQFGCDLYRDAQGRSTYAPLFDVVYVQEGIFSLDGFYGRWVRCTPETEDYLYGPPQHPDTQRLVQEGLPYSYVREHTKINDHFHHPWEPTSLMEEEEGDMIS